MSPPVARRLPLFHRAVKSPLCGPVARSARVAAYLPACMVKRALRVSCALSALACAPVLDLVVPVCTSAPVKSALREENRPFWGVLGVFAGVVV